MDINIAVVPVAGRGTRLLPATKAQPKEMLPVGRKPVVQHVVEELVRSGVNRVLFVTGAGKTAIENHFDTDSELIRTLRESGKEDLLVELGFERLPLEYFYTRQRQQLGLGHAVLCAEPFVGKAPFVVALGDTVISVRGSDIVRRLTQCFAEKKAAAVIAFEEVARAEVVHYGVAKPKRSGKVFEVEDLVEKPSPAEAPSNLAIAGRYVFAPAIFHAIRRTAPGKNGEIQLTDAIRILIRDGAKVYGVRLRPDEPRYDIGNFSSYFRAFIEFALADEKLGKSLRARVEKMLREK